MLEAGNGTKFLSNFANPTFWTLFGVTQGTWGRVRDGARGKCFFFFYLTYGRGEKGNGGLIVFFPPLKPFFHWVRGEGKGVKVLFLLIC